MTYENDGLLIIFIYLKNKYNLTFVRYLNGIAPIHEKICIYSRNSIF